jgi:lycopene beta-cyclase
LTKFDIIIVGTGASGLSLAYHLSKSIWADKSILLLDKDSKENNDRTWCFWSKEIPQFECAKQVYWKNISFLGKDFEKKSPLSPYRYYHIKGLDFYDEMKAHLAQFQNISWKKETVRAVQNSNSCAEVITDTNSYTADWVFNSVPQFSPAFPLDSACVKQYFKGYFIETEQDTFDANTVTLMDFSMNEGNQIEFFYVLPFTKRRALVECTVFSTQLENPENYQATIKKYIKEKLNIDVFSITEEERGIIPMTLKDMPLRSSKHIFHIGAAGGMTKATTGYTFQNIQVFCNELLNSWQTDFKQINLHRIIAPKRFQFYDGLLLHIIQKRPHVFQNIMEQLFQKNDIPLVVKFLDQKSNLFDEAHLFLNLPWKPFIQALYEKYFCKTKSIFRPKSWRSVDVGDTSNF